MLSCNVLGGAGMQCIHLCQAGDLRCVSLVKLVEQLLWLVMQIFCSCFCSGCALLNSTVGSTGKVAGVNLSLDISALVLYILHVLALAGTLIVVASCCCWLATHVQNLMHTW